MWCIRLACSACAASAHAAAPPSKLMKLRRLIRSRQKRTFSSARRMAALPSKADVLTQRITDPKTEIAAGYSKQHRRALAPLAVIGWRKRYQARKVRPRSFWELVMSCYSHSERDAAFAAPRKFSFRAVLSRVADHFHRARDRRRQRQELIDYLASDHRAARDLGITIYDVDNFCR